MADADAVKSLNGLLNGIAQRVYYNKREITEDLLKNELYPDSSLEEFHALHEKMKGLVKSIASADMDQGQLEAFLTAQGKKQGSSQVNSEQAAALSRFWRSHRVRIHESLTAQSRWEPTLRGLSWRVDVPSAESRSHHQMEPASSSSNAMALVELELGRQGEDSEFVCLELDEVKVNHVLKKMNEIQESIDRIGHKS